MSKSNIARAREWADRLADSIGWVGFNGLCVCVFVFGVLPGTWIRASIFIALLAMGFMLVMLLATHLSLTSKLLSHLEDQEKKETKQ